ncbi:MAG: TolC family protein [Cytophagales bacterium]|nr:TolC family protein [Cytophagales bacterium]
MKQINKAILVVLVTLLGKSVWAQEATSTGSSTAGGTYSLQQCIDFALQNHEQIKNAEIENQISQKKVKETTGIGLPQVSGKLDIMANIEVQKQFVPADAFDPTAPSDILIPLGFGVPYSNNANLTISQLIFNGSYLVGLKAAKVYTELSETALTKTKIDVVEAVTKAYYSALVAEERLKLLQINKDQIDALYDDMKVMYENGLTDKLELQRLDVTRNNLSTEITKIKNLVNLSLQLLKYQMGTDLNTEISLSENLESYVATLTPAATTQEPNYGARIEYQQLEVQKLLQELDLQNKKVMRYPNLVGFASLGYTAGGLDFGQSIDLGDWESYAIVGVTLNVPIFSGLQTHYQIQQSKLQLQQIDNSFKMLERGIAFETSQAQSEYENVLSTIETHQKNIELAKEVFEVTKIKYKEGYASNLEVVQAESSLKEAQSNYFGAVYDALVAKVAVEKALGNLHK